MHLENVVYDIDCCVSPPNSSFFFWQVFREPKRAGQVDQILQEYSSVIKVGDRDVDR